MRAAPIESVRLDTTRTIAVGFTSAVACVGDVTPADANRALTYKATLPEGRLTANSRGSRTIGGKSGTFSSAYTLTGTRTSGHSARRVLAIRCKMSTRRSLGSSVFWSVYVKNFLIGINPVASKQLLGFRKWHVPLANALMYIVFQPVLRMSIPRLRIVALGPKITFLIRAPNLKGYSMVNFAVSARCSRQTVLSVYRTPHRNGDLPNLTRIIRRADLIHIARVCRSR